MPAEHNASLIEPGAPSGRRGVITMDRSILSDVFLQEGTSETPLVFTPEEKVVFRYLAVRPGVPVPRLEVMRFASKSPESIHGARFNGILARLTAKLEGLDEPRILTETDRSGKVTTAMLLAEKVIIHNFSGPPTVYTPPMTENDQQPVESPAESKQSPMYPKDETDREDETTMRAKPFAFVSEQLRRDGKGNMTIRHKFTGREYRVPRVPGYIFLNLGFGAEHMITDEQMSEIFARILPDIDYRTHLSHARTFISNHEFPYKITTIHRNNYAAAGYFFEEPLDEDAIEGAEPAATSITEQTPKGSMGHELSSLAGSLLDKRIRNTLLSTSLVFFPSEEMLNKIIEENGRPTEDPDVLMREHTIPALERLEEQILNLKDDTDVYRPVTLQKETDTHAVTENNTWALLYGLVMINRLTFVNAAGKRLPGLGYISETLKNPDAASQWRPIPSDRWKAREGALTNYEISEGITQLIKDYNTVTKADQARKDAEADITQDLDPYTE